MSGTTRGERPGTIAGAGGCTPTNSVGRRERMKYVNAAVTAVVALCAIIVTGLLVHREVVDRRPPPSADTRYPQPDWLIYSHDGHRVGSPSAAAILVVFSDYQCPYCRVMEERIAAALASHAGSFAVVYRHWPLDRLHPHAMRAAIASECAAAQGRFEEFHRILFAAQDSLGIIAWEQLARRATMPDVPRFTSCLTDSSTSAIVGKDIAAAKAIGAPGAPIVMMNGVRFRGAIQGGVLDSLIDAASRARGTLH